MESYHVVKIKRKDYNPKTDAVSYLVLKNNNGLVSFIGGYPCFAQEDGLEYLRATEGNVGLLRKITADRILPAKTLGEEVARWFLGIGNPWKMFGANPDEFDRDGLIPPFNYNPPCEEIDLFGTSTQVVESLKEERLLTVTAKIFTFGTYRTPIQQFEEGYRSLVEQMTNPRTVIKFLFPEGTTDDEISRKRRLVFP